MTDISYPAAMGAGLLSFLSPCVLPLAPPYLCYLAGTSLEALAVEGEADARRDTVIAAVLFVAGFSTVFVALGATASFFGSLLRQWSHVLSIAAGVGIIAMGLHFLGAFQIGAMMREKRVEIAKPPGLWSAYLMGLAFRIRLDALHRADPGRHTGVPPTKRSPTRPCATSSSPPPALRAGQTASRSASSCSPTVRWPPRRSA